ncbi:M48 family metallopeptidase [Brachyspira hampsonii]|uniref:Metal-dependent hydrolase n=1 Tax=Brachyspira hampsonii 30446 TaxID=1289135 RepID=A0A2U4FRP2_9SPIR|nr:SprT family zinc-dependent metalloprotease [Brachyspira hampsonii]EKV57923.1 metal-dependent hydrolase [Brachyspira hampsonii 30446]OEJ19432.1 metal-dependent hydrolase [Brachyspira hampsonii]
MQTTSEIIIEYKKIKNIYIRVKPDLNIYVTAPKRASKKYIYELIEKRREWIEERKEAIKKKNSFDISKKELASGNEVYYLGKSYMLKVLKCNKENIILAGRMMYMYVNIKDKEEYKNSDIRKKHILLDTWYKKEALKLFDSLIKKYSAMMNLEINTFTVKKLKSKWGSCDINKKHLTFNLELMKYPISAVEYIVLHELAHLLQANHSKKFYNIVSLYMPEWKKEKKILDTFFTNL